jgi:hypothetical protein
LNIHERYGRLQEAYEAEAEAHRQTLALLRQIKADPATAGSWRRPHPPAARRAGRNWRRRTGLRTEGANRPREQAD